MMSSLGNPDLPDALLGPWNSYSIPSPRSDLEMMNVSVMDGAGRGGGGMGEGLVRWGRSWEGRDWS